MAIETIDARKAGRSDWLTMVHIDDRSDLYRFHIGSRRFPTAPLARAWVTRKLRGTVPTDPDHIAWGQVEQYRWRPVSFWDDDYGLVIDAEAEPVRTPAATPTAPATAASSGTTPSRPPSRPRK